MATATRREEPPSPGAGRLRLTPGLNRAARLAGIFVLLLILILTFDKTAFFFRLAGAALRSGQNGPAYLAALAKCAYQRPGLLPLLENEAADTEFLAAWISEHLRRGDSDLGKSGYGAFPEWTAAKFPDNVILDSLGISGDAVAGRRWQDFDALFFRLVRDPEFNSLTYPALTRSFGDGRLPSDALPRLLSYLAWKANPGLADRLREWGGGEALPLGPAAPPEPGPPAELDEVRGALARHLEIDPAGLELGENLIITPGPYGGAPFERSWDFLDMSGSEPFARGSFTGGVDPLAGSVLRIMGFFTEVTPGRIPCRAGFLRKQAIPLGSGTYLFTFRYNTREDTERPSFWLADVKYISEREIGPTGGAWRRVLFILRNAELGIPEVQPHLRMWGTGTVWFTDAGLYAIETAGPFLPAAKEALLYE